MNELGQSLAELVQAAQKVAKNLIAVIKPAIETIVTNLSKIPITFILSEPLPHITRQPRRNNRRQWRRRSWNRKKATKWI